MSAARKEKTTKKEPETKYGRVEKSGMTKMFGQKYATEASPSYESNTNGTNTNVKSIEENVAEANELGGVFAIVDPIPTIVGPIGRFPAVPEAFPLHPAIAGFGKRRTGKTYTTRDIFYHCFRHLKFGIVLTRTKMNGFWQKYVPPAFVFQGLQAHILKRLLARQEKLIADWKKEHKKETDENPDAYKSAPELAAFVIMDDCISDQHMIRYNTELTALFVEGRHSCLTVVILTQYPKGIGPMLRGNCDVAIFQPIFQRDAREVLADLYGGKITSFSFLASIVGCVELLMLRSHKLRDFSFNFSSTSHSTFHTGWMERKDFYRLMDGIVVDQNLPGSTPQDPKKEVRTMFVSDYENTLNPQIKFHYYESIDPGDFRLCDPEYWKESTYMLSQTRQKINQIDPVEELEMARHG